MVFSVFEFLLPFFLTKCIWKMQKKKKISQFCRRLFQTHFVSTKYVFISNIYVANIWWKHTWSLNVNSSVPFLAYILVVLCYWCFILFSRYGNILVSASNSLSLIYIWCQWTRKRTNTTSPFHWEKSQWIRAFLKKYWKLFSSKLFLHLLRMDNSKTRAILGIPDTGWKNNKQTKTRKKKLSYTDAINKTGMNPGAHE